MSLNRDIFFDWRKETYILLKTDLCVTNKIFFWCIKIHPHSFAYVLNEGLYILYNIQN